MMTVSIGKDEKTVKKQRLGERKEKVAVWEDEWILDDLMVKPLYGG